MSANYFQSHNVGTMVLTALRLLQPSGSCEDELNDCVGVLYAAFGYKGEHYHHSLGGNLALIKPLLRAYVDAARVGGELWVATLDEHGIVGVALWYGPETAFLATEEQREAGWNQVMAQLPEDRARWWDSYLTAWNTARTTLIPEDVARDGYHLWILATHPSHERRGVATTLVRAVEDIAREHQLAVVLDVNAPQNIPLYEDKMGFIKSQRSFTYTQANGQDGEIWEFVKWP